MQRFEELLVWQKAHRLVLDTYEATKDFPTEERYGLINQMRRSAISIPANIVEGHRRKSKREFLHFMSIAEGSLEELKYYVVLSHDLKYLSLSRTETLQSNTEEVGRMLHGFISYIKKELKGHE